MIKQRDEKGRAIGNPKVFKTCFCGVKFKEYTCKKSKKFCSRLCYEKSLLKYPESKLKLTVAQRQFVYRKNHKEKFINFCDCGEAKTNTAEKCRKCKDLFQRGENHPQFIGGYEVKLKHNRERLQKIKILGNHTPNEWAELKKKFGYMCLCCKKVEPEIKLTRDHIIPISKGGNDTIENIQPLCLSCNCRKYNNFINYIELSKSIMTREIL